MLCRSRSIRNYQFSLNLFQSNRPQVELNLLFSPQFLLSLSQIHLVFCPSWFWLRWKMNQLAADGEETANEWLPSIAHDFDKFDWIHLNANIIILHLIGRCFILYLNHQIVSDCRWNRRGEYTQQNKLEHFDGVWVDRLLQWVNL